jgi:surface protein
MSQYCECNRSSFLATVFSYASVFTGDLNQWDVAKVTTMAGSKLICRVENDVNSCYFLFDGVM